jgi:hypothetical protein
MHLHGLDRIYRVVRNDDGVAFLVRESMIAVTDVQLPQSIEDMVL